MSKHTIIHIGFPKTGTTSIQRFCSQYRTELAQHGYFYPFQPIRRAQANASMALGIYHAAFLYHLLRENRAKELRYLEAWNLRRSCQDVTAAFTKSGLDTLLLSAEGFSMLGDSLNYRKLRRLLKGHELTIVAYIRRLDDWHESMFQQEQLGWYDSRINADAEGYLLKNEAFSFREKLSHFAKALPEAKIIVRSIDDIRARGAHLITDFLGAIGLLESHGRTLHRLAVDFKKTNASLSWQQFQLISFLRNQDPGPDVLAAMRQGINRYNAQRGDGDAKFLTFGRNVREGFLERFSDDVAELNRLFGSAIQAPTATRDIAEAPAEVTRNMRLEWFDKIEPFVPNATYRNQIQKLFRDT